MAQEDSPLLILTRKLYSAGPPSLAALVARLRDSEEYGEFIRLIREYLPEHEREILREPTPASQMAVFASHFEDRFFPLDWNIKDGMAESYADLTMGIPVIPRGMSYDDYEELPHDGRPGIQLMAYLLEDPYNDRDNRVTLAEACKEHIPGELLLRVPEKGLDTKGLHASFLGTKYQGLLRFSEWMRNDTGNFFLDTTGEDLWNGYSSAPEWNMENVKALTNEWQQADQIDEEVFKLAEWIEEDAAAHFEELLDFLLERMARKDGENADERTHAISMGVSRKP